MSLPHENVTSFEEGYELLQRLALHEITITEARSRAAAIIRHWPHYTQLPKMYEEIKRKRTKEAERD